MGNKNRNMSSKQEKEQEWNMAIKVENAAAKSGNGTIEGVGIKADGKFKSPVTNQCFDSQEALDLHLKYLHDRRKLQLSRNKVHPSEQMLHRANVSTMLGLRRI